MTKINRPHYKSPERTLDYLETDTRKIETAGYIFTQSEINRLSEIYNRIHRALEELKRIPPEDYPYATE